MVKTRVILLLNYNLNSRKYEFTFALEVFYLACEKSASVSLGLVLNLALARRECKCMGHFLKLKCALEFTHFIFNKCPITLATVQVPNVALTHTMRITVQ
jgi:hypothetical protein